MMYSPVSGAAARACAAAEGERQKKEEQTFHRVIRGALFMLEAKVAQATGEGVRCQTSGIAFAANKILSSGVANERELSPLTSTSAGSGREL